MKYKKIKFIMFILITFMFISPISAQGNYFTKVNTLNSQSEIGLTHIPGNDQITNLTNEIKQLALDYSDKQVLLVYVGTNYFLILTENVITSASANYVLEYNTIRRPTNGIVYRFDSLGNLNGRFFGEFASGDYQIVYMDGLMYTHISQNDNNDAVCESYTYWTGFDKYQCSSWRLYPSGQNIFRNYTYVSYSSSPQFIDVFGSTNKTILDISNNVNEVNQGIKDTNNTIKDDTVDNSQFDDFFSGFETNGHGVTAIITTPLMLLNHLTQDNCVPLNLSLPYIDSNISLPCADTVMSSMIGNSAWNFFRTIFTGFISYKVLVDLLSFINNMRNPDNDNIEVIDL